MTANTAASVEYPPSAQIIKFPKPFRKSEDAPTDPVDIIANVLEMRVAAAEETLAFVVEAMFQDVYSAGFRFHDDQLNVLIVAALRAAMYQHQGLHHPLLTFMQEHSEELEKILANQLQLLDTDERMDDEGY
jgi:hypothetical protein